MPQLPRLLPVAYHPKAAQIEIASNGWVRRMLGDCFAGEGELLRFLRQRNGIYGPLTVPHAEAQRAQDIADWYQYVTVIDSSVSDRAALGESDERAGAVFAGIVAEFGDPVGPADADGPADALAYRRAAKDLWSRISPGLTPAQVGRFGESLAAFLRGCAVEIHAKLAGEAPGYEECLAVRLDSFGCEFIELMTEYGAAVDMSEHRKALGEVHTHGMRQMIIVNDLLSWRKERAQDDKMTVVRSLIEREGLGPQRAVDRLGELVERHERAYLRARDEILAGPLGGDRAVRAYLSGLDHLIGGSQEFEYLTPRYFGDGSVWDGTTHGWLDLDAPVTRFRETPERPEIAPEIAAPAECPVSHGEPSVRERPSPRPGRKSRRENADRHWTFATAPDALPMLGHALRLWRDPLEFVASLPARGDLVEVRIGPKRAYLACHPDLVNHVLTESRTYDKGGPLFERARMLVGNGLVSSNWSDHRTQRRHLQPAFHRARIPAYAAVMAEEIDELSAEWCEGVPFDVNEAMHALTLRVTARTLFGMTASRRAIQEVAHCMPIIMRGVYQRMVAPLGVKERLPLAENRRYEQVRARMHAVVGEALGSLRAGTGASDTLLSILVAPPEQDAGPGLSDDEIYDQVMTLLIGGTETTGNILSWAFSILTEHPVVEQRLHAELDRVLDGRIPTVDDVPALDYTWRVLTEALRMYPPAWVLTRTTTHATELAGRRLEPGAIVMYSPYAMGRNPRYFEEPDRFDPDRWLPDRVRALPRGTTVPFGAGSRKCIGEDFGQVETTLSLAIIASRWYLRPVPGHERGVLRPRASLGPGPLVMRPSRRVPGPVPAAIG